MVQALSSHLQEVPAEDVLLSLHNVPQVCTLSLFESSLEISHTGLSLLTLSGVAGTCASMLLACDDQV